MALVPCSLSVDETGEERSEDAQGNAMSEQPERQPRRKPNGVSGVAIPAGLFIGMGVGFLVDDLVAGLFIGLGAGFVGMIVIRLITGEW